jgi:hypothetical protein
MYENLRSRYRNYAALGVQRFLLARAIESQAELKRYRQIIPASNVVVCRLVANIASLKRRIEMRESGMLRQNYIDRVSMLDEILSRAQLEDFTISNERRPVTEVATELLVKCRWIRAG